MTAEALARGLPIESAKGNPEKNLCAVIGRLWSLPSCVVALDYDWVLAVGKGEVLGAPQKTYDLINNLKNGDYPGRKDVFVVSNRLDRRGPGLVRLPEKLYETLGDNRVFGSMSLIPGRRCKDLEGGEIKEIARAVSESPLINGGLYYVDDRPNKAEPFFYELVQRVEDLRHAPVKAELITVRSFPLANTVLGIVLP